MKNLYVRPSLTATAKGVCRPDILIRSWLDQLDSGDFFEFVTAYLRLTRVNPAGFAKDREWEKAVRTYRLNRDRLLIASAKSLKPSDWLKEAASFVLASDQDNFQEELITNWAGRLIADLDDADLISCQLSRYVPESSAMSPSRLASELAGCRDWLDAHLDHFFPASVAIQTTGQTIRPDLIAVDLELALTADKFICLLDAEEEAESLCKGVLTPELARALLRVDLEKIIS